MGTQKKSGQDDSEKVMEVKHLDSSSSVSSKIDKDVTADTTPKTKKIAEETKLDTSSSASNKQQPSTEACKTKTTSKTAELTKQSDTVSKKIGSEKIVTEKKPGQDDPEKEMEVKQPDSSSTVSNKIDKEVTADTTLKTDKIAEETNLDTSSSTANKQQPSTEASKTKTTSKTDELTKQSDTVSKKSGSEKIVT